MRRPRVTLAQARAMLRRLHVDPSKVSAATLRQGMCVELEHGRVDTHTNITNDRLLDTAKIALAHLEEFDEYYTHLARMEARLHRRRDSIYLE